MIRMMTLTPALFLDFGILLQPARIFTKFAPHLRSEFLLILPRSSADVLPDGLVVVKEMQIAFSTRCSGQDMEATGKLPAKGSFIFTIFRNPSISEDGYLRLSSSHYHMISRWIPGNSLRTVQLT